MDILTGLTAASQAAGLIKQLRDLDKALDETVFKSKLLELQEEVLTTRSALLDAKQVLLEKDERIFELELLLKSATSGEICPACSKGSLRKTAIKTPQMRTMVLAGIQEWEMTCDAPDCGHKESKLHDPNGILKK